MKQILFFIMVVLLVGCKSFRPTSKTIRTVKDSTWTETTYHKRDTVIFIPGDTTRVRIPLKEITAIPQKHTNGRTTAIISRTGDNIDVECITSALEQKLELLEKFVKENSVKERTTEVRTEVPVEYTPFHIKVLAWIGGIAVAALVILIGLKFLKPI